MNIPAEFDEIRPYQPEELPQVFEELIADPAFQMVVNYLYPDIPFDLIAAKMRKCKTNLDFQMAFGYDFVKTIAKKYCDSLTMDCSSLPDKKRAYTYISNHRDIVLDAAFLSALLIDNGMNTVEIAIGDNLLVYPWIKKLVRVNKSFIVQRALTMRQMLESSQRMSRYIHYAISEKHENVWIAQREGRAKDSNDRTQDSVLKMLSMGGEGGFLDCLKQLHIMPVSISYEYDPCDYLKALEFQLKRDNPDYKKTPQDDLLSMQTGLFGYKGQVHFQMTTYLNDYLDTLDASRPKGELFTQVSNKIDRSIHLNYRFYPGNYVAYDWWKNEQRFADRYTPEQKEKFQAYIEGQLAKINLPNKDTAFLLDRILAMYANPLINYLEALQHED
ncbi:1-acyl-sn-glycerol-3-phosphate acyltransferase [Phocaeicola coprophilus]|nr:1-acyl-sn-glycerol-3-phosphate acyltransferase [Phocaeicola coprophilus]